MSDKQTIIFKYTYIIRRSHLFSGVCYCHFLFVSTCFLTCLHINHEPILYCGHMSPLDTCQMSMHVGLEFITLCPRQHDNCSIFEPVLISLEEQHSGGWCRSMEQPQKFWNILGLDHPSSDSEVGVNGNVCRSSRGKWSHCWWWWQCSHFYIVCTSIGLL